MKIKISGSGGYVGKIITDELIRRGHHPAGIPRELLYGPADQLADVLKDTDSVVHLAGSPILTRWTEKNRKLIMESRVGTAKNLADAINLLEREHRPRKVISASGISIYAPGITHTEKSTRYDTGFLGNVINSLEKAWNQLSEDVDLVLFRMAPVLGKKSPAIRKMNLPFKLGAGGKVGHGNQPFPFVHEKDVAAAYLWAIENPGTEGIYNLAAPQQIDNAYFTRALADALHRPAFLTVPALALKVVYGPAAAMLLHSPAVRPERLLREGFRFKYENIGQTLDEICH